MGKIDKRRAFKLRFRRRLRLQRRQVEEFGAHAEQRLEADFFKRLERLGSVKRFVISWVLLLVLLTGAVVTQMRSLSKYYQELIPVSGGTYTEGIVGSFTNASPLYATDIVDASVSHLIFAGLLTYDQRNALAGDLADRWTVNETGTVYTVHLRDHLTWQDGVPLTADDVLFTYQVIQNPDARSPLNSGWRGIKVTARDPRTVVFTLPNPLASFPYSLTNGIVPKHLLANIPMSAMRSASFNTTRPVGAGPFQWQAIELNGTSVDSREEHILLRPFTGYRGGKPKLSSFVVRTFRSQDQLVRSFKKQEVNAVVGLTEVPDELKNDSGIRIYNLPLTAAIMTFFRTSQGVLADGRVRSALVQASDVPAIVGDLSYATLPVREPLLKGQLAYNPAFQQPAFNRTAANAALEAAGWVMGRDGVRHKDGQPLSFQLYAQDNGEYARVARQLVEQWKAVGVDVQLQLAGDSVTFQSALANHDYDAVLYGISIGVDPDVFVYWHSSQADPSLNVRLNLSEYKTKAADASLEAGRTRLDPALRTEKYKPFLQSWQADAPALGLYQPRFLYITNGKVYGLGEHAINTDAERFTNVHNWQIREGRKTLN